MSEPATFKQMSLMNKLKIPYSPDVTKQDASQLIDSKMGNKPKDITDSYPAANPRRSTDEQIKRQVAFKAAVEVALAICDLKNPDFKLVKQAIGETIEYLTEEFDLLL